MNNGAARYTPGTGRSNPLLTQSHRLARSASWGTAYRRGRIQAREPSPVEGTPLHAPELGAQILPFPARPTPFGA